MLDVNRQEYTGTDTSEAVTPQFLQAVVPVVMDAVIIIILISWAVSVAKKAWRGEEVDLSELSKIRG